MNQEINQVCVDCGRAANYLTCWLKYGAPPKKRQFEVSTFAIDSICDFCGRKTDTTEVRDFFYPDFILLRKVVNMLGMIVPANINSK